MQLRMFADDHDSYEGPTRLATTTPLLASVASFFVTQGGQFSRNTLNAYRGDLRQFVDWMTDQHNIHSTDEISPFHITQYREHLGSSTYAPASIERKIASVRTFLRYLWDMAMTSRSLEKYIPRGALRQTKPKILSPADIVLLLSAPSKQMGNKMKHRDTAILHLLYATGMRVGEIVDVDVGSIEKTDTAMSIRINKSNPRVFSFNDIWMQSVIDDYLEKERPLFVKKNRTAEPSPALFLNTFGRRLSRQGVWYMFRQYATTIGLSFSLINPRTLRNTAIHHLVNRNVPYNHIEVQQSLGIGAYALQRYLTDTAEPNA